MYLPNYKDGSIVNLMSSISRAFGTRAKYKPLKILNPSELKSKNIVLIVIDGLGYEYLMNYKKDNTLAFPLFANEKSEYAIVLS